jgi:hypothetical protein
MGKLKRSGNELAALAAVALLIWSPLASAQAVDSEAETAAPVLKRYAIVVGNGDYLAAPDLGNAVADARLVAEFFTEQGYQVLEYRNLGKLGFEQMLRRALHDVNKQSEVVFYYAGHGVQIAGGNYLVPVDADLDNAYDVPFETISLTSVVNILGARARLQMIILDSCRDNPFGNTLVVTDLTSGLSETRDGFNLLTATINSLLAFSTAPGAVAWDGAAGTNSPFTAAMVETARAAPATEVAALREGQEAGLRAHRRPADPVGELDTDRGRVVRGLGRPRDGADRWRGARPGAWYGRGCVRGSVGRDARAEQPDRALGAA